jgi:nucleoside-diphosphate-sugar epimerase
VLGPSLTKRSDGGSAGFMMQMGNGQFKMGAPDLCFSFVDVRDVADAHIAAFENSSAKERYIVVNDSLTVLQMAQELKKSIGEKYPLPKSVIPKWLMKIFGPLQGFSWKYIDLNYGYPVAFDNARTIRELGINFMAPSDTLKDHMEQLLNDGLVKRK